MGDLAVSAAKSSPVAIRYIVSRISPNYPSFLLLVPATAALFVTFSACRHHTARNIIFFRVGTNMAHPQLESTEAELIRRVCGGEPQAFEELLRPYERLVYATAISILRNPADAEEVAQEAVLKAFSKLSSFRGESRFSTWLLQITYNEARMKLRKERQHLYESIDREQRDQEGEYWPRDFADWRPI
ncbi:MAG: sigma-70 family RNA polymerase sigma factor, partial [Candidatus Acidiferrales bacterium]